MISEQGFSLSGSLAPTFILVPHLLPRVMNIKSLPHQDIYVTVLRTDSNVTEKATNFAAITNSGAAVTAAVAISEPAGTA